MKNLYSAKGNVATFFPYSNTDKLHFTHTASRTLAFAHHSVCVHKVINWLSDFVPLPLRCFSVPFCWTDLI